MRWGPGRGICIQPGRRHADGAGAWPTTGVRMGAALWRSSFAVREVCETDAAAAQRPLEADGTTPMHVAARKGNWFIPRVLADAGADVDARTAAGVTPLQVALQEDLSLMSATLLALGANVQAHLADLRWTPLHLAAWEGDGEALGTLAPVGADLEVVAHLGWTPLHVAVLGGHARAAALLLDCGVDVAACDKSGGTPLLLAAVGGHADVVGVLVDRGADVSVRDKIGVTPLHVAAAGGHADVVRVLVDRGAGVSGRDRLDWLLDLAAAGGHVDVVEVLNKAMFMVDGAGGLSRFPAGASFLRRLPPGGVRARLSSRSKLLRPMLDNTPRTTEQEPEKAKSKLLAAVKRPVAAEALSVAVDRALNQLQTAFPSAPASLSQDLLNETDSALQAAAEEVVTDSSSGDEGPSSSGGLFALGHMLAAETLRWKELHGSATLSNDSREALLRSFCQETTAKALAELGSAASSLPSSVDLVSVQLPVLGSLSPAALGVLGSEAHHAFEASAVAYAGRDDPLTWLRSRLGGTAAYTVVSCVNDSDGVSSTVLKCGSTHYVASAGLLWQCWGRCVDFLAVQAEEVETRCLLPDAASLPADVPARFSVNPDAWAACLAQQRVLDVVCEALSCVEDDRDAIQRVVFCGHGIGGAVAQLLAVGFALRVLAGGVLRPVIPSLVTFGSPSIGDAAFQECVLTLTRHVRLYVEHDPVAGLPHSSCIGLRFSPSTEVYAEPEAREHWALSLGNPARAGSGGVPRVPSLSIAGLTFASHHSLHAYAACLSRHCAALSVPEQPS